MKITVFTSNQPRHCSFINGLSKYCDEVFAVQECLTVAPGIVRDFYDRSEIMQEYFSHVLNAERKVFGGLEFSKSNVRTLALKSEDLNLLDLNNLSPALNSDLYIVFGASFIKGELLRFLVANNAINIHMGLSPYYRGASTNFWALFDGRVRLVGATIHRLSGGLDSGDILFHAFPNEVDCDPFEFGMRAVKSAQVGVFNRIADETIMKFQPVKQKSEELIRYCKNSDFSDDVAENYLKRDLSRKKLLQLYENDIEYNFVNPMFV